MQAPPVPPERCILILGGDNVGKSTLTFRYVLNVFVDPKDRDPTSTPLLIPPHPSFLLLFAAKCTPFLKLLKRPLPLDAQRF